MSARRTAVKMLLLPFSVLVMWPASCGFAQNNPALTSAASENDVQTAKTEAADSLPALRLLGDRCLHCHNDHDQEGDLSLQTATSLLQSGYVIPGAASDSHLLDVLTAQADGMPATMPKDGSPLSSEEIRVLRQWIDQGAVWPDGYSLQPAQVDDFDWWSLRPVVQPVVPEFTSPVANDWIRNPVDAFVWQQLDARHLTPSPSADRRTLIRRIYYDLTGLPPSPADVEAFVADDSADAWEQLVETLLASPRYGECWGRHWLDVARYADTCGYDKDKLRPNAWPYRDYVIRSFNQDKPWGQFVQEQIAGDALFPGQPDGVLGLGFLAAGPWDFIGHVEVPESKIDGKVARNLDRDDMISSVMNAFCSTTVQCARCHNHKFDPLTQEHYYGLQAIFAAVDRAERIYDTDPQVEQQRFRLTEIRKSLDEQLAELQRDMDRDGGAELVATHDAIAQLKPLVVPADPRPEFGFHSQISPSADALKWVQIDLGQPRSIHEIRLHPCHDDFAGIGPGFGFPVRYRVSVHLTAPGEEDSVSADAGNHTDAVIHDATTADVPNPGLQSVHIHVPDGRMVRWIRVTATRLAERSDDYILALAELQAVDADGVNLARHAVVTASDSIEATPRWSQMNLTDDIWPRAVNASATRQLARAQATLQQILARIQTPERMAARNQLTAQLAEASQKLTKLPQGRVVYAAATHFADQGNFKPTQGQPRPIHLLHRGNETQPLHAVAPAVPPLSAQEKTGLNLPDGHSEADRRAALARWVTNPQHPLTWRSAVNRVWQYHFGQGIVDSPNDFGRMGQLPSHPELLDWLTQQLLQNDQSIKHIHRLILNSATYQQSSAHREDCAAVDGGNQFVWHMSRRRLSAEEVRDSVLAFSGRLDLTMGGPGYYVFELEKLEHSPHYVYSRFDPEDIRSHRRSVYRFVVRSQPDPFMTTLDCADSSQSTPQRNETLTSLQALALLNDPFQLSMARHFARDLQSASASPDEQIRLAFHRATGRPPTDSELRTCRDYVEQHGLTNFCRLVFNLSEFLFVD